jgi:hypothetical protein
MLKTVLLLLAGLGAGLAIAFGLRLGSTPPPVEAEASSGTTFADRSGATGAGDSDARLVALEEALAAEVEQRIALESRVAELSADLEAFGERPRIGPRAGEAGAGEPDAASAERVRVPFRRDADTSPEERERRIVEQLMAAGFAPDRAEWIHRRSQELRMEAMQAQYEARRAGRPEAPDLGERALREELGDADYERFLTAMGRSTTVAIDGVLASSPAERAGLVPGDEIIAYNGRRVFDIAELNELTLGGETGESVVVDVRRNGQALQLVLPRGPIGIWGGFRGAPVRVER